MWQILMTLLSMSKIPPTTTPSIVLPPHLIVTITRPVIPSAHRVNVTRSPYRHVFFNEHPLRLTIDTGAETNMIKASLASYIGASITKSSQQALQADGNTPLTIVGDTRLSFSRNDRTLTLEALVVKNLDVDILAGTPFMTGNDIAVRPATQEILIAGCDIVSYGFSSTPSKTPTVRCCPILRAPLVSSTIWPGNFLVSRTPFLPTPNLPSSLVLTLPVAAPPKHPMPGPSPPFSTPLVGSFDLSIPLLSLSLLKRTIISARLPLSPTPSLRHPYHLMCPPLQPAAHNLRQAHSKFDELEAIGVFKPPEELGVVTEYLNPSFLVKKRSGGFRLVTAFTDVGR